MVKNLILRAMLILALLANVIYANAQAYEFTSYKSDQDNLWNCDCTVKLDINTLRFQLASKSGITCIFSFIYGGPSGFSSLSSETRNADVKIYLSNGEILSTTEAGGGNSLWINFGAQTLKSSMSNSNDKGSYAMGRLREYDITKITVNGKEYPTPNFRSAVTINAMCKEIISNTGDQGQFGNGPSTVPISANISNVTVEHNQILDHSEGMSIKMKLNVNGLKGKNISVIVYFYDEKGIALKDNNQRYYTTDGNVCSSKSLISDYEECVWNSLSIFIPYSELHLSEIGTQTIKYFINVRNNDVSPSEKIYETDFMSTSFYYNPNYLIVDSSSTNVSASFGSSGGVNRMYVYTSDSSYDTWGVPDWCYIKNKTSTSFDLVCQPNNSMETRTDYMKVKAAGKEVRIDISQKKQEGPTAIINNLWVEHNVINGMAKGMKVHVNLDVIGMLGRNVAFCVFYYQNNNSVLLHDMYSRPISYMTTLHIQYQSANFSDLWVFIPYSYLLTAVNRTNPCTFNVEIQDENHRLLTCKTNYQVSLY